jgi:glycosyltransferase involved in cell wall biosynthesis
LSGGRIVNILTRVGEAVGRVWPWKNKSKLFFFFPFYQVGGAEKIHADIVGCVADRRPYLFFTNQPKNRKFKSLFEKHGRVFDISSLVSHRYAYYICLGALTAFINRHDGAVVFGCNSFYFYHLLPHLRTDVRRLDLLHAFGGDIEHVSLPYVHEIDTRVVYSSRAFSDLKAQYAAHAVEPALLDRVRFIDNQVAVPDHYSEKPDNGRLKVMYVGRGAEEKRVHLIGRAAAECRLEGIPAEFIFVGDVAGAIGAEHHESCSFKGEIAEFKELERLYNEAHVLVLTSSREGFPVVIMEAMAHGVVSVSTDVGGISDHVRDGINGLLIGSLDEDEIVAALVARVRQLASDRTALKEMSGRAYEYARQHFTLQRFCAAYRQLILAEEQPTQKRSRDGHGS